MFKALLPWDTILHIYNPKSTSDTQRINQPCLININIDAGITCRAWYLFNSEKTIKKYIVSSNFLCKFIARSHTLN